MSHSAQVKKLIVGGTIFGLMALCFSRDQIGKTVKESSNSDDKELTHIGYSEQQIEIIHNHSADKLKAILASEYQQDIVKILTVSHYARLKGIGYSEEDLANILVSDETIVASLQELPYLKSWKDYLSQSVYRSILNTGYSENIGQILFAMPGVDIMGILKNGYKPTYDSLITSEYTVKRDLIAYLAYWESHPDLPLRNLQEIINTLSDHSSYTEILPVDRSKGNLYLVNKHFRFSSNYVPAQLTTITICGNGRLIKEAADALRLMCRAMILAGLHPNVISSYRSYITQTGLYNRYVKLDGKSAADTYSARPGHSEHQSGTVFDIVSTGSSFSTFKNTEEYKWMVKNAKHYGFILRYEAGKQAITGYISEPWHWRYVGIEVAMDYNLKKMTFDEYYRLYIEK